jgi:hypothetical protein
LNCYEYIYLIYLLGYAISTCIYHFQTTLFVESQFGYQHFL